MRIARPVSLAALLALISSSSFSHDDLVGTRFVATNGVDQGDCDHPHQPCRTIAYALTQIPPGGTVKVAAGIYSIEGIDADDLLHGKSGVLGGFSTDDEFKHQDLERSRTIVYGLPAGERDRLLTRGLSLMVDPVAQRAGASRALTDTTRWASALATQQTAANCVQGLAGSFPCHNVDLLAQVRLADLSTRPGSMSNLWGFVDLDDNREYAVVGVSNATVVIDVTDPVNPREVGSVPGNSSLWREVKVYQFFDPALNHHRAYAYITTEAAGGGLQIIDLSNLPNRVQLANTLRDFQTSHTLHISNVDYASNVTHAGRESFLFIAGSNLASGAFRIYSLADPVTPQLVTVAPAGTGYMHDSTTLYLTDNRTTQCSQGHNPCQVLVDFNETTVDLWDVTDKAQPVRLSSTGYADARYTHSGWPTEDQRFVFVHDELDELRIGFHTQIYTLDIGDLRTPRIVTSYFGPDSTTDHNGYVKGNRDYVSHYRRGLVIMDITQPEQLREVGNLDTFLSPPENVAGTDGAWGVYPFLPSGNILISDIDNGLFVLRDNTRALDASPGRLGFVGTSVVFVEGAGGPVWVRRSGGNLGEVSVDYAMSDGSAAAGSDYVSHSGTLTWGPGDDSQRVIPLAAVEDAVQESTEQLTITLSNFTGGATPDGGAFTVSITDNDAPPPPSGGGGGGGGVIDILSLLAGGAALGSLARRRRGTQSA
ncbi:MAG TPA: choice-of-anchor B family protein [Steroidobacteraceae bacterium]|nr:choice-of-anchor B family protein [Steroidobacteraceae bacterium]